MCTNLLSIGLSLCSYIWMRIMAENYDDNLYFYCILITHKNICCTNTKSKRSSVAELMPYERISGALIAFSTWCEAHSSHNLQYQITSLCIPDHHNNFCLFNWMPWHLANVIFRLVNQCILHQKVLENVVCITFLCQLCSTHYAAVWIKNIWKTPL